MIAGGVPVFIGFLLVVDFPATAVGGAFKDFWNTAVAGFAFMVTAAAVILAALAFFLGSFLSRSLAGDAADKRKWARAVGGFLLLGTLLLLVGFLVPVSGASLSEISKNTGKTLFDLAPGANSYGGAFAAVVGTAVAGFACMLVAAVLLAALPLFWIKTKLTTIPYQSAAGKKRWLAAIAGTLGAGALLLLVGCLVPVGATGLSITDTLTKSGANLLQIGPLAATDSDLKPLWGVAITGFALEMAGILLIGAYLFALLNEMSTNLRQYSDRLAKTSGQISDLEKRLANGDGSKETEITETEKETSPSADKASLSAAPEAPSKSDPAFKENKSHPNKPKKPKKSRFA